MFFIFLFMLISAEARDRSSDFQIFNNYYLVGSRFTVLHEPTTEQEIRDAVLSNYERGTHLKVVGAAKAMAPINLPDEGELMDLRLYNRTIAIDPSENTATFETGIYLKEAGERLETAGFTFTNGPSLLDFNLAGVISTGANGRGGFEYPGFSAKVVGLRLVLGNNSVIDVSESSYPDIFHAAQLGIGYMGIISTVTMKIVPLFKLEKTAHLVEIDDIPSRMDDIAPTRFFIVWTYPTEDIATMTVLTPTDKPINPPAEDGGCHAGTITLGAGECVDVAYRADADPTGTLDHMPGHFGYIDSECYMPTARASAFAAEWIDASTGILRRYPDTEILHYIRSLKADSVWMSPAYKRDVVKYGILVITDGLAGRTAIFSAWRSIVMKYNCRMHWGKHTPLTVPETIRLFPKFYDYAEQRRIVDPTGVFLNDWGQMLFRDRDGES